MENQNMVLPKVQLGNTGYSVSQLALGGFHQVEISSDIIDKVVTAYQQFGGNYIETARSYGDGASEKKLGRVLEGRRDQFILCSKSGAEGAREIRRDIEASLTNLQTDHIEFYYFHGVPDEDKLERILSPGGALEGMLKAKEEGLIGGIGLSSHNLPMYIKGMSALPVDLILIWCNYLEDMYLPEIKDEIFPFARKRNIGITAMKPLGDGFLYRSPNMAMRYAMSNHPDVLVCGMNTLQHVSEAVEAVCQGPLTAAEQSSLLMDAPELGNYVCRQCGNCSAQLKELFRLEGYVDRQMIDYLEHDPADYALRLRLSSWFSMREKGLSVFKKKKWDEMKLLKEAASVSCPYRIDVSRKVRLSLAKLSGGNLILFE
ncbi:aldo/keto reductase [Oceanispirochaeta crateris]|uniref:Aldo/keto reductase n=1 Tax=Oceanispirochaeta crateris TaxID=2518645 RepID=A0A5C1QP36_9SPIO|nr:aldo/keto reductase [Oceanispirochaeta crateris]QEN08324.1 aldo/keto reductase [Oceanispirochaeta crateris]